MEYTEGNYLDRFLTAMKIWDTPVDAEREKRQRIELTLKDVLCDNRTVTSRELRDWDDSELGKGTGVTCWVGDHSEQIIFIYDADSRITRLWWVQGGLLGRSDQLLLRITQGDQLGLETLLASIRRTRHNDNSLW